MIDSPIQASFRRDLKLYPGPKEINGAPTYNLYDPISAKYYKLGWEESVIYKLAKKGMSFADIAKEVNRNAPFTVEEDDVQSFYQQSAYLGLLDLPKSSETVMEDFQRKKSSPIWWLLMNYLYFRLPLFKPDAFLQRTLPSVKILWSSFAIFIYVLTTLIGLGAIITHFDEYIHTFTYFFNFEGFIMYAITIFVLKIVHELSHAYTAKNYHIQVPSIGVAVIVLWPVLYTDVTDSWKLASRKQRLVISIAGVTSELVIAGLSTFGWLITTPGILQSIFFLLSSTTWISSAFINFNPAMRFDGYYILCDLWGIDNLRARAFSVTRWKLHEWMFGFGLPCPEEGISKQRIYGMMTYSIFTWIYLIILYTAIAVFVYYEFTKALGIILFLLEIGIFFMWPIVSEFQELYKRRSYFRFNMRTIITLIFTSCIILWLVLPLPRSETIPAITIPHKEQVLYAVEEGKIDEIFFKLGDKVNIGDPVIQISQDKLEKQIAIKNEEKKILERMIEVYSFLPDQYSEIPAKKSELLSLIDQINQLASAKKYLVIKAMITGTLFALDDTIKAGQPIAKNQILGRIADTNRVAVIAFVPEKLITDIYRGQEVVFTLPYSTEKYRGKVSNIESVPAAALEYPALTSRYKGPIAVTVDKNQMLKPVESYFRVKIDLEESENQLLYGKVGKTVVTTPSQSILMRILSYLQALIMHESSL